MIAPDLLELASTLFTGLLVKSSIVAVAGLSAARWIARRPADRVDILRATLILLLALPVLGAVVPALRLDLLPAAPVEAASVDPLWSFTAGPVSGVAVSGDVLWPSATVILGWIWAAGAAAVVGRLIVGVWTLNRWTRAAETVRCPDWTRSLDRLVLRRRPRLVASDQVAGPLSWGLPPGAIVIDRASLTTPDAAPAILAHEMAHVRRHDWAFLMLSRLALALFWFNPLVWKVHAALAAASEDAADAEAVQSVDRAVYARALIGLAAQPVCPKTTRLHVALGMAADPQSLKKRISLIMTQTPIRRRPLALGLTVAALAAVATPLAALELHSRDAEVQTMPAPPAPPAPPILTLTTPPVLTLSAPVAPPAPPVPPVPGIPGMPGLPVMLQLSAPPAPPSPPSPPAPPEPPRVRNHYLVIENGVTREATPAERASAEQARAEARQARVLAREARISALSQAEAGRATAGVARVQAEQARAAAAAARGQAMRARVDARAQMRGGAEQMRQGAARMRREAERFNDPAHRAEVIERARARGDTLTDAQVLAIGTRLTTQADRLEQRATTLETRATPAG